MTTSRTAKQTTKQKSPATPAPRSRPRPARSSVQASQPYRQGRRKRAMAQQVRRMEVAISGVPGFLKGNRALQTVSVLRGTGWHAGKLVSVVLLAAALYGLGMIHTQDAWFVYAEDVAFVNLSRLQADDLYAQSDIEGINILWFQPQQLRRRLLENVWIEDARVKVGLPASVTVEVQEMQPVALWVTSQGTYWLAANGASLPITGEPDPGLPQIVDSLMEARDPAHHERLAIDPQILSGAMTLLEAMPELESKVRYNRTVGLNFPLPNPAVWVYWGNGFHMEEKLTNLAATLDMIRAGEEPAQIVDIRLIDRPYVR